jgi:hypothetical protein
MKISFNRTVAALTSIALLAITQPAVAQERAGKSPGIIGEAERWLTAATAGPTVASDPTTPRNASTTAERATEETTSGGERKPFVDFAPNASLVARDWRGSMKLAGQRTMLVDDLRPTASNRMVVARIATNDAWLTTFAQLGAGEWRIDTAMFPNARSYSEMAGQIGGGFELRLPSRLRIAGEAQYTMLPFRDISYTTEEVAPRMVAFVLAIDGRF